MITKGAWRFEYSRGKEEPPFLVVYGKGFVIADVETKEDAVAISALPDLIKACRAARKRLLNASYPEPFDVTVAEQIDKALKKAGIEPYE